jgi:SAM-dependent methyltransferase
MVFGHYANFYDVYYRDKDYVAEVDFVLKLANKYGSSCGSVLDMGCGTGRHLEQCALRGLECVGFDRSETMFKQARKRLGERAELFVGDLTSFECNRSFDVIVSMFAVMGYLVDNESLIAGLLTAAKHMHDDSVFIFDGWFGPAVLSGRLEERSHRYETDAGTVERHASPVLDAVRQCVRVEYEIVSEGGQIREEHTMRYFFVQEMRVLMQLAGLIFIKACPFMAGDQSLTAETWNVTFVARKA